MIVDGEGGTWSSSASGRMTLLQLEAEVPLAQDGLLAPLFQEFWTRRCPGSSWRFFDRRLDEDDDTHALQLQLNEDFMENLALLELDLELARNPF